MDELYSCDQKFVIFFIQLLYLPKHDKMKIITTVLYGKNYMSEKLT